MRLSAVFKCVTACVAVVNLFWCTEIPTDPVLNPDNASVHLFLNDTGDLVVDKGGVREFGIEIKLPQHFTSIAVTSSCGNIDTTFEVDTSGYFDTLFVSLLFKEEGQCIVTASAAMQKNELKDKTHSLKLHVLPEKPSIHVTAAPPAHSMRVGQCDTLLYVTRGAGGIATAEVCSLSVMPSSGTSYFVPHVSLLKDTIRIVATPAAADTFTLKVFVAATYNGFAFSDSCITGVRVKNAVALAVADVPENIASGTADTLVFAVDNSTRSDQLALQLYPDTPLDPAIFSRVPSGPDSLLIAVASTAPPSAQAYTIGILISSGTEADTSWYRVVVSGNAEDTTHGEPADTAASRVDTIPPSIKVQPVLPDSIFTGDTVVLKVEAAGSPALRYQWSRDGGAIEGATDAVYVMSSITSADNGEYTMSVKSDIGAAVTTPITVKVLSRAVFTEDPQAKTANEGDTVIFSVTAAGDAPLTFQWQKDSESINGENGTTITIAGVTPADSGAGYRCIVKNAFSSDTSLNALLLITATPVYTARFATGGGSSVDSQRVKAGEKIERPSADPVKNGYLFAGWYLSTTAVTEYDFNSIITGPTTLYARWTPVYTVSYDANGGSGSITDTAAYTSGAWVTVKSGAGLSRQNYTFDKWATEEGGSGSTYASSATFQMGSASITLYAQWKRVTCVVTFDGNGATTAPLPSEKTVEVGAAIQSLPNNPQRTGYIFDGWWTEKKGAGVWFSETTPVTKSLTVYASWIIKDVEGNVYSEITLGKQVWLVENLKTTHFRNGTPIPNVTDPDEWVALTTPGVCWFNNDSITYHKFSGVLYNWYSAADSRNVAPIGWHVPSDADWSVLETYLIAQGYNYDNSTTGNKIAKSLATKTDWQQSDVVGSIGNDLNLNNRTQFSAVPGGYRFNDGTFYLEDIGGFAMWWTSTPYSEAESNYCGIWSSEIELHRDWEPKKLGKSIRCIRDY